LAKCLVICPTFTAPSEPRRLVRTMLATDRAATAARAQHFELGERSIAARSAPPDRALAGRAL
jgi:hypothetical protein